MRTIELGLLGFDHGAQVIVSHAVNALESGAELEFTGSAPGLSIQLVAWARTKGHEILESTPERVRLRIGSAAKARWHGAEHAIGTAGARVAARPPQSWGLAARGSWVEAGGPPHSFALDRREDLWTADLEQHYRAAAAAQWNPETAIDWKVAQDHPDEVEDALVQVFTYLIENETAALRCSCPQGSPVRHTPISARACSCSQCRPRTKRDTSKFSRGARACSAASSGSRP